MAHDSLMTAARRDMSLLEAVRDFCDPRLVARAKALEWRMAVYGQGTSTSRLLGEGQPAPDVNALSHQDKADPKRAMNIAWQALLADLRQRIQHGHIVLSGVPAFPVRGVNPAPIPGVWAADFCFEIDISKISIVQFSRTTHVYVAVRALAFGSISADPPGDIVKVTSQRSSSKPKIPRRHTGRKTSYHQIEAALREHWSVVEAHTAREGGRANLRHIAALLEGRMRKKATTEELGRLPQVETIRKHLRTLYPKLVVETANSR